MMDMGVKRVGDIVGGLVQYRFVARRTAPDPPLPADPIATNCVGDEVGEVNM
jgi:hypothetical protein